MTAIQENSESALELPIPLPRTIQITKEVAAVSIIAALVVLSRLWMLGARVMSHDESLHVYYSWLLSTGQAFAHNPMMHGPLLFEATALMDWFFGASDFSSRLLPALAGIFIAVAVPQLLKHWLGRAGALAASVLLLASPFVTYFSRYIRHDIPVIAWTLLAILAIFRYLEMRKERDLMLLAGALALMLSTMEISFIYLAILAGFLILNSLARRGFSLKGIRYTAEFDLLIILITLGGFFSSPITLLGINPIWQTITGTAFVDLKVLDTQDLAWATGPSGIRLWGLLGVFSAASAALGLWWDRRRWPGLAAIFLAITVPLFTTFFSNPSGLGTGFVGSLGYWLSQQGVARGSQPWYYYLVVFPIYEYLPLIAGISGALLLLVRRNAFEASQQRFVAFLVWWAIWIFTGLTLAGEKMPWLSTHIAVPFILLAGWWIGRLIEKVRLPIVGSRLRARGPSLAALGMTAVLLLITIRTSIAANYINYDYVTEFIDYAHSAPGVKQVLNELNAIASHTGAGQDLRIAYDDEVTWPMVWYMREFRNLSYYGAEPNPPALDVPVVLAGPKNWDKVESILGSRYHRFEVIRMWWPMEDYKDLTWERIRSALMDPAMREALGDIFWDRDYRKYSELTSQPLDSPKSWPLEQRMRIYVKKEVALQMLSSSLGEAVLEDLPPAVNAYEAIQRPAEPIEVITNAGLAAPRNLAIAPDGSIYVADTGNSRIIRLNSAGEELSSLGSRTPDGQIPPAPSTFLEPWGVAVDAQGNLYVADTWNHRVQKFDSAGTFLLEWNTANDAEGNPIPMWGPRGIAVGGDGRVYVTDTGNKRVLVFDQAGIFLFQFDTSGEGFLDEPVGIALGPDGIVYIADTWNQRVAVFSSDGTFLTGWDVEGWTSGSLDNKPYIAVDSANRVYITDPENFRVIVFSPDGDPLIATGQYSAGNDGFGLPVGIAIASDDSVWVADTVNNRLAAYDIWK